MPAQRQQQQAFKIFASISNMLRALKVQALHDQGFCNKFLDQVEVLYLHDFDKMMEFFMQTLNLFTKYRNVDLSKFKALQTV